MKTFLTILTFIILCFVVMFLWEEIKRHHIFEKIANHFTKLNFKLKYLIVMTAIALFFALHGLKLITFKDFCFSFIEWISLECLIVAVYKAVNVLYELIHDKAFYGTKEDIALFILLVVLSVPSAWQWFDGGVEQPGALFEKSEYNGNFIVAMSKKPETEQTRTIYHLPAHISKYNDETDNYIVTNYLTGEKEEKYVSGTFYHIEQLYFENGNYLIFDDENIVMLEQEIKLEDPQGEVFYITLTDKKATNIPLKKSNDKTPDLISKYE